MSHRRSLLVALASGGGAATLALGLVVGAPTASAMPAPTNQQAHTDGDDLITPGDVVGGLTTSLQSPSGTGATGTPSPDLPTGAGNPSSVSGASGGSGAAPLAPIGSSVKDGLEQAHTKTAGTPIAQAVPGSGPGQVLKLSLNAAPLAAACAQVTGTGTAAANLDATVAGHDVGRPLVEALPGVLAPCPSGSVPTDRGADAAVSGLVGACVRLTDQPPLQGRLLVLDHELISELTRAGVPLNRLVVPCPAPGHSAPGTGHGKGSDGQGSASKDGSDARTRATGSGTDHESNACDTNVDTQRTSSSFVPTSAPQALPWLLLSLALVGRRRLARVFGSVRARMGSESR